MLNRNVYKAVHAVEEKVKYPDSKTEIDKMLYKYVLRKQKLSSPALVFTAMSVEHQKEGNAGFGS